MVLLPSARARSWVKVKLAKHLFEHRYDYRTEWLRFTDTLGRTGADAPPLGERIVKAFADIVDAPGGLLLVTDDRRRRSPPPRRGTGRARSPRAGRARTTPATSGARSRQPAGSSSSTRFARLRRAPRICRSRAGLDARRRRAWAGVPLIHNDRLVGLVLLAAPEYRRPLDWEDFDLLRTAGRQAASSLAEAHGQEALSNAQRFEEFNRRFAFILHDIKNLVSQLSLRFAQCRAPRRQSRIPRRHGRDAARARSAR